MGDRVEKLSKKYHYELNEAHDGYIETYLNSGLIGLSLLMITLFSCANRIKRNVLLGSPYDTVRLAFLMVVIVYNVTEAAYNRLGLVWFVLLLMIVEQVRSVEEDSSDSASDYAGSVQPADQFQEQGKSVHTVSQRNQEWSIQFQKRMPAPQPASFVDSGLTFCAPFRYALKSMKLRWKRKHRPFGPLEFCRTQCSLAQPLLF